MPPKRLLRDYIGHALAARAGGYFTKDVVGGLTRPLDFAALKDERTYRRSVADLAVAAASRGSAWLTPCEVFTPHYARAVARSIVARHRQLYPGEPLQILGIGGGNGTFAADVLTYVRSEEADLFPRCRYLLLEVSERLADIQRTTLQGAGFDQAAGGVEVHRQCALAWAEEAAGSSTARALGGPWHIAMLEVLDNLPHDKVRLSEPSSPDGTALEEAYVIEAQGEAANYAEAYRPLNDATLRTTVSQLGLDSLEAMRRLQADMAATEGAAAGAELAMHLQGLLGGLLGGGQGSSSFKVFVPTGSRRLLSALCRACPEHQFTIADFSWLPPQPGGSVLAPVVQTQWGGHTIDLEGDYLRHCGSADILFATNFEQLSLLVRAASAEASGGRRSDDSLAVAHVSTAAFMRRWHDVDATATQSGFNPLLDDFSNTRFLVTGEHDAEWPS